MKKSTKDSGSCEMLSEFVSHTEPPETIVIIANVTTKGIILSRATA